MGTAVSLSESRTHALTGGARLLAVLEDIADHPSGTTAADVSARLGLHKSIIYRNIATLRQRAYITMRASGLYVLGPSSLRLASSAFEGRNALREICQALADTTGETVTVAILHGTQGLCVYNMESRHALRYTISVGSVFPLHLGAVGHALIATQSDAFVQEYVAKVGIPYERMAERRQCDLERGYSFSNSEVTEGARSVAAVIPTPTSEPPMCIALSMPSVRMPDRRIADYAATLQDMIQTHFHQAGGNR